MRPARRQNPIAVGSLLFRECPFIRGIIWKEAIIKGLSFLFGGPPMLVPKGAAQIQLA
jgi:hypothetical protein